MPKWTKKQLLPHPPDLPIEERVWRYQHVITHGVDRSAAERPRLRRLPGRACLLRGSDFADSLAGWAAANWNG